MAAAPGLEGVGEEEEEEGNIMDGQTEEQTAMHLAVFDTCMTRMRTESPPDDGELRDVIGVHHHSDLNSWKRMLS